MQATKMEDARFSERQDCAQQGDDKARLLQLGMAYANSQALYVAAKLSLADILARGPASVAELARATEVDAAALGGVVRVLESLGVFTKVPHSESWTLTGAGRYLRGDVDGSLKAIMVLLGEEEYMAFGHLLHSVKTGRSAFPRVFGQPFYEYLQSHPEASVKFSDAMSAMECLHDRAVAQAYTFTGSETIVDVGGGHGSLLASILETYPQLRGVLFDLPKVVERARTALAEQDLSSRCRVEGGDFFERVPNGDVILLRRIVHNHNDADCARILGNCHAAVTRGGRVLIIERILEADARPSFTKLANLSMLVLQGGRERTEAEYVSLLRQCGFEFIASRPTESGLSIVEGRKLN